MDEASNKRGNTATIFSASCETISIEIPSIITEFGSTKFLPTITISSPTPTSAVTDEITGIGYAISECSPYLSSEQDVVIDNKSTTAPIYFINFITIFF